MMPLKVLIPNYRVVIAVFVWIFLVSSCVRDSPWELPIALGQSIEEVRAILGAPTEVITGGLATKERLGQAAEWHYSSGLVATYQDGRLSEVILFPYATYRGFLPYGGRIVNGLTLGDSRDEYVKRLGPATKSEQIEEAGDLLTGKKAAPNEPSVWPAREVLYWRLPQYVVEASFLMQSQAIDSSKGTVFPRGTIDYVKLYK